MMRVLATILVVFTLLRSGAAAASEQSELLYSRGLVPFHKGSYSDALPLFEQAVQADPKDAYALYYRGVAQGRLGNYAAAVTDLRAAMALKPELTQGALELGVALVQTDQAKEALPWLEQARSGAPSDADAAFFLGLAQLRVGQLDAARANFSQAATLDPKLSTSARYYQGVTEYQAHNLDAARQHFDEVAKINPDSEMGREATAFLTKISEGKAPATVAPPYALYGSVGFQYDSNLQLSSDVADNQGLGKKQEDGRTTLSAGAAYAPWRSEHAQFSIGYEFFQSLHFQYSEFNLENHRVNAQLLTDLGPVQIGLMGRYDYYMLKTEGFLQQGTAEPWVTVPEGEYGRSEVFFRVRRRDFMDRLFQFSGSLPVNFSGVSDSFNYSPGMQQFVYLGAPDRYLRMGYRFDRQVAINSAGNRFAYDGHEVGGGVGWALPLDIGAELNYAFRRERYAQQSNGRRDEQHQLVAAVSKPITDHLDVTVAYFGVFNNSNTPLFGYDRSIASLSFGVRF